MHPQSDVSFPFGMREQRVKAVNFDVCKNLQNQLVTMAMYVGLPQNLCQFCNRRTYMYRPLSRSWPTIVGWLKKITGG